MTYHGIVRDGVVVFEQGPAPPEGANVSVQPLVPGDARAPELGTLGSALLELAGVLDDLPADLARNHDHNLHGHPRR